MTNTDQGPINQSMPTKNINIVEYHLNDVSGIAIHIYPEHVVDEIHQAPEEKRRAIDCIFLWCFICESDNKKR